MVLSLKSLVKCYLDPALCLLTLSDTVEDPVPEPAHHAAGNLRHPPPRGVGGGHGQPPLTIQHHHHRYTTPHSAFKFLKSRIIFSWRCLKFNSKNVTRQNGQPIVYWKCAPEFLPSEQKLLIIYACSKNWTVRRIRYGSRIWIYSPPESRIPDPTKERRGKIKYLFL